MTEKRPRITMSAAQTERLARMAQDSQDGEVTIQGGDHGYIELERMTEGSTRIYEIAIDGSVSRAA